MNGILKYPGSKWRIAKWIIDQFPSHRTYLEPFFGSGAVFFTKPRSPIETINDLDGNVTNLFECIREDPENLARLIYYTPYSRDEYEKACARKEEDKFEKARSFLISSNMGFGRRQTGEKNGFKVDVIGREKSYAAYDWATLPDRIIKAAERLRGVQIENRQATHLLDQYDYEDVLIYIDPPYVLDSRIHGRKQYRHEMTDSEHINLLERLNRHKAKILISGYESNIYTEILSEWRKETITSLTTAGHKGNEILWMNFEPVHMQLRFSESDYSN